MRCCFFVGAIFEVTAVDTIPGTNIRKINLRLSDIGRIPDINLLISQLKDELKDITDELTLGNYLLYLGKYEEAETHFENLLRQNSPNNSVKAAIHCGIIRACRQQKSLIILSGISKQQIDWLVFKLELHTLNY